MNKVSIIIPVYNVEKYLRECLDSVKNQTYRNLEIILIDDGSTDNSGKICDEYVAADSRFVVIHQDNAGAANAKNVGLNIASGEYVGFIDSDDIVENKWIESMLNEMSKENADLIECNFDIFTKTHIENVERKNCKKQLFTPDTYMEQYLDHWTNSLFWLKIFRIELTQNIRFRTERRCIDDEFYTYKVVSQARKIVRIEDVLYHYRKRQSSAVRSVKNQRQITKDAMELRPERYLWIKERYPQLRKKFLISDMDYILYLINEGIFDTEAKQIYKWVSRFYRKEAFSVLPDKQVLMLYFLLIRSKPVGKENLIYPSDTDYEDYFE